MLFRSAASTRSCSTLFNKGSRSSIVIESSLCSTHTPRFLDPNEQYCMIKKKLRDPAAGVVADLDTISALVSGPNILVIWQ